MKKNNSEATRRVGPAHSWSKVRLRDKLFFVVTLTVFSMITLFSLGAIFFHGYDAKWVECDVVSAWGGRGAGRSVPWQVSFHTTDCETISFSEGIYEDNAHEIADSIDPDKSYEFQLDWFARVVIKIGGNSSAMDFREIPG